MDNSSFIQSIIDNDYAKFRNLLGSHKVNEHIYSFQMKERNKYSSYHQEKPALPETNLSLLHIAAYCDSLEIFIYLQEDCHLPLDFKSISNYSPIHYACYGGSLEVVSYILQKDPKQATILPDVEHHLLYLATCSGNASILSLLFRCNADICCIENERDSAIIQAIKLPNVPCLKILLKEGSRRNHASRGYTPIMEALKLEQKDAIPLLLEYGEDPSSFSEDGQCALSIASFQQYTDTVRLLCEKIGTIEPNPMSPHYKRSAVHWGCQSYTPEIMEILLEKNIDVNALDSSGYCGPHYLIDVGNDEDNIKILEMLYRKGFNPNIKNPKENISLLEEFMTSISNHFEIIQWLIEHNADLLQKQEGTGIRLVNILQKKFGLPPKLKELIQPYIDEAKRLDNQEKQFGNVNKI